VGVEFPMQVFLGGAESPVPALVAGVLFWGLFPAVTGILTSRLLAEERGYGNPGGIADRPDPRLAGGTRQVLGLFCVLPVFLGADPCLPARAPRPARYLERSVFTPWSIAAMAGIGLLLLATFHVDREYKWLADVWATRPDRYHAATACWLLHALHEGFRALAWITAGIDPAPVMHLVSGHYPRGGHVFGARLVRFQSREKSTRGLDAGAPSGVGVRAAGIAPLLVRERNARVFAGVFRQRSRTLPAVVHSRPTRYPTTRSLCECDVVLLVHDRAQPGSAANEIVSVRFSVFSFQLSETFKTVDIAKPRSVLH
jgi:hypothetical protein